MILRHLTLCLFSAFSAELIAKDHPLSFEPYVANVLKCKLVGGKSFSIRNSNMTSDSMVNLFELLYISNQIKDYAASRINPVCRLYQSNSILAKCTDFIIVDAITDASLKYACAKYTELERNLNIYNLAHSVASNSIRTGIALALLHGAIITKDRLGLQIKLSDTIKYCISMHTYLITKTILDMQHLKQVECRSTYNL